MQPATKRARPSCHLVSFSSHQCFSYGVIDMPLRFEGKVVVVTGAGSGVGAATAKRFHDEGDIVVLNGRRESKLSEVAAALGSDRYMIGPADVSTVEDVEPLVADVISRFEKIDILVNNAGTGAVGDFLTMPVQQWRD